MYRQLLVQIQGGKLCKKQQFGIVQLKLKSQLAMKVLLVLNKQNLNIKVMSLKLEFINSLQI